MKTSALILAAALSACASVPAVPPYRAQALPKTSPFAAGECGIEIRDFKTGTVTPAAEAPLPAWAGHAVQEEERAASARMQFSPYPSDGPDYRQFLAHEIDLAKQAFSQKLLEGLVAERKARGAGAGGVGMSTGPRQYALQTELITLTPPAEDPPSPMKMTLRLTVGAERGAGAESVEIDTETPGADFRGSGQQLADKYAVYVNERLGCWLNWQ